jgi:hypothetical protein
MFTFPRAGPSLTTLRETPGELYVTTCLGQVFLDLLSLLVSNAKNNTHYNLTSTNALTKMKIYSTFKAAKAA